MAFFYKPILLNSEHYYSNKIPKRKQSNSNLAKNERKNEQKYKIELKSTKGKANL